MSIQWSWLRITDGTAYASGQRREVNLLCHQVSGFCLTEWRPRLTEPKGGGVWSDSALAAGRRMHIDKPTNVIETMTLEVHAFDQDTLIRDTRTLRQLLEKARAYWTSSWATEPVWIEAQGIGESLPRYALLMDYRTPQDGDPYGQPFWQCVEQGGMSEFELILEREPYWRDCVPGQSECLEIGAMQAACAVYPLRCYDTELNVTIGNPDKLKNLIAPAKNLSVEGWFLASAMPVAAGGYLVDKSSSGIMGWSVYIDPTDGFCAIAHYSTTDALYTSGLDDFSTTDLNTWHHFAAVFLGASDRWHLWLDGQEVTYSTTQPGVGDPVVDETTEAYLGARADALLSSTGLTGYLGWVRISNNVQYIAGETFNPPSRCVMPGLTNQAGTTLWLGVYEGDGTTIHDQAPTPQNGTAANDAWGDCCEEYYGNYTPCSPKYMVFNATTSLVNCGTGASLEDLPDADFTVEAWVFADGWGENNEGYVISKGDGWALWLDSTDGLTAYANYNTTDAITTTGNTVLTPDGLWHHIAATWDESADSWAIFVDGVNESNNVQAGVGVYQTDAAAALYLGNNSAATRTWDGGIQWVHLTSHIKYAANFTPPVRCTWPEQTNTISLWVCGDEDSEVHDLAGLNPGTPVDLESDCDCIDEDEDGIGEDIREETCDEQTVFVGNHHKIAQLTQVMFYDDSAAAYSPNLLNETLPYGLLPPVPAVDDMLYLGIDADGVNGGPFSSVVFDLATISDLGFSNSGGVTYWQYLSTTGWDWLNEQDNTNEDGEMTGDPFSTAGPVSVHWEQPDDWSTSTINGVNGYWVRCIVTSVTTASPPLQQNRHPYTISWPFIEVQEDKIGGDVPAIFRMYVANQSDNTANTVYPPCLYSTRMICGLRSLWRGEDFTPYINLSEEQNPEGITVTAPGADANFADRTDTVTGQYIDGTFTVTPTYYAAYVYIAAPLSQQYIGTFHAFLRMYQESDDLGDMTLQLYMNVGDIAVPEWHSEEVAPDSLDDMALVDFGQVQIPPAEVLPDELGLIVLQLQVRTSGPTVDFSLYDLILMPVDEWALDTQDRMAPGGTGIGTGNAAVMGQRREYDEWCYLDVDSIAMPKRAVRSNLKLDYTDYLASGYLTNTPGPAILQANAAQRLWFLFVNTDDEEQSQHEISNSLQMWRVQRYLSMRGNS